MRPIQWQLQSVNVSVNPLQKIIYKQFAESCEIIGKQRKKKLVTVFVGDAIEGIHHGSKQFITARVQEHEKIAEDAIDNGLRMMKHGKDDKFYMVSGTESHVGESEERIASDVGPVAYMPAPEDKVTRWCWPMLPVSINGVFGLIAHHGPGPGSGANEGNPLRNKVRNIVVSRALRGKKAPRFIVFGHKHAKQHIQYEYEDLVVDAFILPSFQGKTDWFYSVDPFAFNNIGMLKIDISAGGDLSWQWLALELSEHQEKVEIV